MKTRWLFVLTLVAVLAWFGYEKFANNEQKTLVDFETLDLNTGEETKTNVPFEDLTIPYLRDRSYKSVLGERKIYQSKTTYDSYLTSYVSDGLKINGLLTVPRGVVPEGGWPAVVFVHGYIPPTLYKTTEKYVDYVDYLAKNGLVVFKIDLRGHGESEGEAGGAYYSSDYVVDVLNAYRALQNMDVVDENKIYMWGHSMAGNVLFRAAIVEKTIPKVVIWAGAVYSYEDFVKYGLSDNSYKPSGMSEKRQRRRQEIFDTYGQFSETSDFWKKVSAVNFLDGVKTMFQVHHAADDSVVNVGYSRDLKSVLESRGVRVEYFEYKTGGHNISGPSFSEAMWRTVDFLNDKK